VDLLTEEGKRRGDGRHKADPGCAGAPSTRETDDPSVAANAVRPVAP
jgi:hypothetical protein